jgi:hypothetical protein
VSPASALPLAAGLGASASDANTVSMIDQVQYRRGFGGPRRGYYGYRRGGIGPGAAVAGVVGLGILGAAAAAAAQPNYYPAPAYGYPAYGYGYPAYGGCYWERRPVFDAWGNPRGTHPFQVCR